MGAWGERPDQNDDACDLHGDLLDKFSKLVVKQFKKKKVHAHDRWARLGALKLLMQSAPAIVYKARDAALLDLEALKQDTEWLDSWKDEDAVKTAMEQFRTELLALEREYY